MQLAYSDRNVIKGKERWGKRRDPWKLVYQSGPECLFEWNRRPYLPCYTRGWGSFIGIFTSNRCCSYPTLCSLVSRFSFHVAAVLVYTKRFWVKRMYLCFLVWVLFLTTWELAQTKHRSASKCQRQGHQRQISTKEGQEWMISTPALQSPGGQFQVIWFLKWFPGELSSSCP